jgi:hypothetical protein
VKNIVHSMAVLSLSFEDIGEAHNDLVLNLDEFVRRCDTYYLASDPDLLPDQRDADKVRSVLVPPTCNGQRL